LQLKRSTYLVEGLDMYDLFWDYTFTIINIDVMSGYDVGIDSIIHYNRVASGRLLFVNK